MSTTTITVRRRPVDDNDPYEPEAFADFLTGVRAHISAPSGREQVAGGSQEVIEFRLDCDPIDLKNTDQVIDENTGITFDVVWAFPRRGLGLDHMAAGLKTVGGVV